MIMQHYSPLQIMMNVLMGLMYVLLMLHALIRMVVITVSVTQATKEMVSFVLVSTLVNNVGCHIYTKYVHVFTLNFVQRTTKVLPVSLLDSVMYFLSKMKC